MVSTNLVEAADKKPQLFIVHAAHNRSWNLVLGLVPSQILHFFFVIELRMSFLIVVLGCECMREGGSLLDTTGHV